MEKVICDICGTEYPQTEEVCPLCGCSRDMTAEMLEEEEDFLRDSPMNAAVWQKEETTPEVGISEEEPEEEIILAAASFAEEETFDFGDFENEDEAEEENDDEDDDDEDDDDEDDDDDDEESGRGRTGVVILLTIVIILLLTVCGFLFVRYLLPNMGDDTEETTLPTQTQAVVETTTEPGIPCEQLILMSGAAVDLTREGEYRLVNVIAMPEDTTDKLEYYSADETIATVNSEGRITAISEGETVITVICGFQKVQCRVYVHYEEPTEAPTEEIRIPTLEVPETQSPDAETEQTEAAEAATQPAGLKDVTLKLGRTDISMGVGYEFTIPLECDLSYEEIEWSTGNAAVATIENGVIKTHSRGTTQLFAKYGDQVVTGWIRVK